VLDRSGAEGWNPIARTAIAYTRRVLSDSDLDFLGALPASFSVSNMILAVHDTPVPNEHGMSYLRASRDAADAFFWIRESICLVGHTHVPACFVTATGPSVRPHVEDVDTAAVSCEVSQASLDAAEASCVTQLPREGRAILNPGSVGQPRDRDPRASYCVLDLARSQAEFRRVAYDIDEAMRRTIAVGLPTVLGERLALGA
jgi:diadenosine tetraphosphatase ApaH/serine/threonine PP2A family protein phosphatase